MREVCIKNLGDRREFRYAGAADLVLQEGQLFEDFRTPTEEESCGCAIRQCFSNSFHLTLRHPERYVYCEGYATNLVPGAHHAWVYDKQDKCPIDPTWSLRPDIGLGQDYIGVPFKYSLVYSYLQRAGCVLDDHLNGHPVLRLRPEEFLQLLG